MSGKLSTATVILVLLTVFLLPSLTPKAVHAEVITGQTGQTEAEPEAAKDVSNYIVGPEDVLEISVWKNPDLSKVVTVRPDGMISLPIVGDLKAAGLTPTEIRDAIVEEIKAYQSAVVVSVIVQEVNSYRVFVVGEVNSPGTYSLKTRTSVVQAIALAGGFTQFASKNKILLVRDKPSGKRSVEKLRIRFDDILKSDVLSDNNLILLPGDTIIVP